MERTLRDRIEKVLELNTEGPVIRSVADEMQAIYLEQTGELFTKGCLCMEHNRELVRIEFLGWINQL